MVTLHYVELILGGPAYGKAVDLHYSRDQLIAVVQSDLGLAFTGGGINEQELFDVATDPWSKLSSSDKAACYIQYLLSSSLFTDKSGNIAPSKLWPLAWIYIYFPMFAPTVRPVRWTPYKLQEIQDIWVSTWHGFMAYFDCVEAYMIDRVVSHPRIQNPMNIPCGFHVPVDPPMPVSAFMDLIAREVHRDDVEKEEKYDKIADLVKQHYRST
ncbi:hypothetical protein M9H77_12915 [Catharanthus roseus]|uniref:Uncharacterized protein n=1 Tax=Catharanthus roseus TaxID=4058 RepID=A0ACC0BIX9_CATRO|nr:hypothetical protein M9H77_12915 [Catharanthus roseus]